jgi:foldase protein PrsA
MEPEPMSERTHSTPPAAATRRHGLFPIASGTIVAVVIAAIAFQIYRAEPAQSQTRPAASEQPGTAQVAPSAGPTGGTVAVVNGQQISYDIVAARACELHGKDVLENIINQVLINQECKRRNVSVSQAEVMQEVHNIAKKFNLPTDTWYSMLETERGISKEQYHRDIIWPMLALKKLAGTDLQLTEKDLQEAFIRDYGPRVQARVIYFDGNIRQATKIAEQAQASPDDFERLAREWSSDPNTKALGGAVPPIRRYGGAPTIENVAFKLQPGEVSSLVEVGPNKFVILKCESFTEPVVTNIEDVREALSQQLTEEKTQESVAKIFEEIKTRATILNHLAGTSTKGSPYEQRGGAVQQTGAERPAGQPAGGPVRSATGAPPTR